MSTLVATVRPHSKSSGWKQCTCCPYGYHIDLDFVRYCESIANSQILPRSNVPHRKPRKRASMDVLLGLPYINTSMPAQEVPPCDILQKAVQDFELTLKRATKPTHAISTIPDTADEKDKEWLSGQIDPSLNKKTSWSSIVPPGPSSINREKSTVSNAQTLPRSQDQNQYLNTVITSGSATLPSAFHMKTDYNIRDVNLPKQQAVSDLNSLSLTGSCSKEEKAKERNQLKTGHEYSLLKKRSISVGTSLVTRDVGVNHKLPLTVSCGVMTDEYTSPPTPCTGENEVGEREKEQPIVLSSQTQTDKYYELTMVNRFNQTDLKMDAVYSSADLDRHIDKAIKMYEKTYHHLLHPKKQTMTNVSVQVEQKVPTTADFKVQVKPSTSNFGTMIKTVCSNSSVQTQKSTRDIGVSDNTILNPCAKCAIKKVDVGVNVGLDIKEKKYIPLSIRSKSFDTTEMKRKFSKSVAVGADKILSSNKSTDTIEINLKKDVSVSTIAKKLVDCGVDPIIVPAPRARKSSVRGSASKIPRPSPPKNKTFLRQNTYTTFSQQSSRRSSLQNVSCDYESGSEDGASATFTADPLNLTDFNDSTFHPILPSGIQRLRKELPQEVNGALKVLNDGLVSIKEGSLEFRIRNAINIVQEEWFKISSSATANPLDVEDYLDFFEEFSSELLLYIVNMTDNTGNTAMHYAVSHGNFDVVSILLDSKVCDINKRNSAGYTSIMLVSLVEVKSLTDRQVVRRLFQLADVNVRALQHGQTALMLAVSHGRIDMVQLLIDSGADINIQDDDGSTALMCAAEHDYIEISKLLLSHPDCDLTITDYDGNSALNIAMEAGNRDLGVLLYAQQHFSRGSSPYTSFKIKKSSSNTPIPVNSGIKPLSPQPNVKQ